MSDKPPSFSASAPHEPLHIVVVDDDDLVRETMVDWLEAAGFATSAAACFTSGLELLKQSIRIDALVTDYNLAPTVTGVQLALEARKLNPVLPIVLVTGDLMALSEDQPVPGAMIMAKGKGFSELPGLIHTAIAQTR